LPPGFGKAVGAGEVAGGGEAVVIPPAGGNDETDWAWAAAARPANKPRLRTLDLSKLGIEGVCLRRC
jgi:hypothetical protein